MPQTALCSAGTQGQPCVGPSRSLWSTLCRVQELSRMPWCLGSKAGLERGVLEREADPAAAAGEQLSGAWVGTATQHPGQKGPAAWPGAPSMPVDTSPSPRPQNWWCTCHFLGSVQGAWPSWPGLGKSGDGDPLPTHPAKLALVPRLGKRTAWPRPSSPPMRVTSRSFSTQLLPCPLGCFARGTPGLGWAPAGQGPD